MGKTALIVDDSRTARVVLQRVLETHELAVDTAESAEEALTYLGDKRPDIIFMDHLMPGMDGLEAVSTIKNNPRTASIPIMMYTAQKGEVYVGQARALGAAGVLPKRIEPVEVTKVLASLRIIDRKAEQRSGVGDDDIDAASASGDYPNLENFDQNLRTMIEDLFDQQRAILHRDLLDSQELIAARVADEIRVPEVDELDVTPTKPERSLSALVQLVAAAFAIATVLFAWLFWRSEQGWQDAQQENVRLQQVLDERQSLESQETVQIQQRLAENQESLASARTVALSSLEWAANQSAHYSVDELPMDDFRLSVISALSSHLMALDWQGMVRIESHVGNFCMSFTGPDGYALAAAELPAIQCDQIGLQSVEAYEVGLRQSTAFANYISVADDRTGGRIRFELVSFGNSKPLLNYPDAAVGISASTWNEIAASNNRVEISLHPDER